MADHARMRLLLGVWIIFTYHFSSSFMAARYWMLYFQQDQATTTCFLTIFSFAFTVILTFLQLKYQAGQDQKSPFQTHPKTMHVAVTSLLIYCLLYSIQQKFSSHPLYRPSAHLIPRAMLLFALLSLLSTASVLFPDSIRGVFYLLCILLPAGDLLDSLFQKIKNRFSQIQVNGYNIMRFTSVEHRLRPSV